MSPCIGDDDDGVDEVDVDGVGDGEEQLPYQTPLRGTRRKQRERHRHLFCPC